jgi:pimeloyl-ACP methyl ester carboxylesterase
MQLDISHQLENISVRSQYILGTKDPVVSRSHAREFRKLKNIKFSVYEDKGHFIPLASARRFNQELLQFLKSS